MTEAMEHKFAILHEIINKILGMTPAIDEAKANSYANSPTQITLIISTSPSDSLPKTFNCMMGPLILVSTSSSTSKGR